MNRVDVMGFDAHAMIDRVIGAKKPGQKESSWGEMGEESVSFWETERQPSQELYLGSDVIGSCAIVREERQEYLAPIPTGVIDSEDETTASLWSDSMGMVGMPASMVYGRESWTSPSNVLVYGHDHASHVEWTIKKRKVLRVMRSTSQEEVLLALRESGAFGLAEYLQGYLERRKADLEEGEYPGIRLDSLKAAVRFLLLYDDLPYSAIRADFDGYAYHGWFLSSRHSERHEDDVFWVDGDGQITLRFVTLNLIEFAMISGPWLDGAERLSLSGTMSHSKMKIIIGMFFRRMVSYVR